jgi:catalase
LPINAPVAPAHNNQRDGMHRQAIARGRVSYEPNSLGGGCPFQAGVKGFVTFPPAINVSNEPVDKVRGKPEKFAEHYNQATLFFDSQTAVEKAHIIGAFRFELSKVTVPAIRTRVLSSLLNVSEALASAVAAGLGLELPDAMPRAAETVPAPEINESRSLSLMALPGDGGIATRKVAVLVADGVDAASIAAIQAALTKEGAVTRLVGARLGTFKGAGGISVEADATLENSPGVLFDGVIVPDGEEAGKTLAESGQAVEFLRDQYRHCKTFLIIGTGLAVLQKAGIGESLRSGKPDPGLLVSRAGKDNVSAFIVALGKHRHVERDQDPPSV